MKHLALVLFLGAVAGAVAHALWFSARRPVTTGPIGSALVWLQQDLQLTEEQFARVQAIHEQSGPQLQHLAREAARMRAEFNAFERRRETIGEIDFLAFARFVETQRHLDRLCAESTHRLIAAAADEMNPGQRERYLDRLDPALRARIDRIN